MRHPLSGASRELGISDPDLSRSPRPVKKASYRPDIIMAEDWGPERSHRCPTGLEKHQKKNCWEICMLKAGEREGVWNLGPL